MAHSRYGSEVEVSQFGSRHSTQRHTLCVNGTQHQTFMHNEVQQQFRRECKNSNEMINLMLVIWRACYQTNTARPPFAPLRRARMKRQLHEVQFVNRESKNKFHLTQKHTNGYFQHLQTSIISHFKFQQNQCQKHQVRKPSFMVAHPALWMANIQYDKERVFKESPKLDIATQWQLHVLGCLK
ncbi:Hypothetical_protein [Hexamita inflata]|uniref:Hypothetical_protein n=2 Tax=Hexamita inflata TaxID=28002 RepID=A0ABP1GFD1_9EUKA